MPRVGAKKRYTPVSLDGDERAYIEAWAARDRVSLAQVVRWCIHLAMSRDTINSGTSDMVDTADAA